MVDKRNALPPNMVDLRCRAENRLGKNATAPALNDQAQSPAALHELLHQLQVHQIELEMQNDELRRAQLELDAERARYFDLYELAPVGYCTLSESGLILESNLTAATLLGVDRGALFNRPFTRFVHKADQDIYYRLRQQLLTSAESRSCELRLVDNTGTPCWAQLTATTAQDEAGASVLRITLNNINALRLATAELVENEARLRALFDSALDAVISMDAQGRITDWNARAEAIFGWRKSEALGLNLHDTLASVQHRAAHRQGLACFLATGEDKVLNQRIELTALRRNGDEFPVELSILPFKIGDSYRFTAFVEDISERKQLQEHVQQLAFYDALTELPNRRLFEDRQKQAMVASERSGCHGALIFLDLDNFKLLNDARGHEAGDLLLREVARRLANCVRQIDSVARFGGDEFVVLLRELDADRAASTAQAASIAEKIRASLAEPYMLSLSRTGGADHEVEHRCSASLGVTMFLAHEERQSDVLKWADDAMYEAKAAGRNGVKFHAPKADLEHGADPHHSA